MSAIGRNLLKLSRTSSRQFSTTVARRGDFQMEGVPGSVSIEMELYIIIVKMSRFIERLARTLDDT